jgi:putative selenate reductase
MAELVPARFEDLVLRMIQELRREDAIFHLPRRKWWTPDPAGPDLSVRFHGRPAGTPVGPAAGPHTQMAQNLVLSWLAGGRILELKTVQINDRLRIGRPCIDATNVGYNIEWSQELRIDEALQEYVAGAMLIHMLARGGVLEGPIATTATETIYDLSVGYDLAGIQSAPMRSFIERMKDAGPVVDRLRGRIPLGLVGLRDLDYPTRLSGGITLSTFHGCPAGEIERICSFLISEMDCDVVIKMNPPMLGRERLEHLLYGVMGYHELRVPDHAYTSGLQFGEAVDLCGRLTTLAASRGRKLGAKFSNTLEVVNHRKFFTPENKTQYLSGAPLHVITLALADEFRRAIGPSLPFTFSAGVDRQNFAKLVACGFCPVTVCTDLLRPGGYGRLPAYLASLSHEMGRLKAGEIGEYILRDGDDADLPGGGTPTGDWAHRAAENLHRAAARAREDRRYRAEANRKEPRRIDSHLATFDCITCDKCLPVCPNAANFIFPTRPQRVAFHDWVVADGRLEPGPPREIVVEHADQIGNFADFCNDCGNCDTFCPEYGGPFIAKPNFFGSLASWAAFPRRDGFFIDVDGPAPVMHGRYRGRTYRLSPEPDWAGFRFEDGVVCLFLRAGDHAVERWFAFGPHDATGHTVDMEACHTMRILLESVLSTERVHQVNVRLAASGD